MSIGSRIKEARTSKGITQEDLAQKIGVTKSAVANYENEVSTPKVEVMYNIFKALNCDANYLYQDQMIQHTYRDKATPDEMEHLVKKYRSLDPYGQESISILLEREVDRCNQFKRLSARTEAFSKLSKDKEPSHIMVNAAHERTDIEITDEMRKHDDDIMDDENF